jgi:hypothetical protein
VHGSVREPDVFLIVQCFVLAGAFVCIRVRMSISSICRRWFVRYRTLPGMTG